MAIRYALARLWYGSNKRIASSRLGAAILAHTLYRIDLPLLRWSHGRLSLLKMVSGLPAVTLTTTGAKSGKPHTVPLVGLTAGANVVLIASNFGRTFHPAWYYNLRAHPEATLELRGRVGIFVAREATPDERAAYWPRAVALYPGYAAYEGRTRGRPIPMFVLAPKAS